MAGEILVLTARDLLDELLRLRAERPDDFDDLAVYVEVVDQESYYEEQAAGEDEYTSNVLAEGSVYEFQIHTPISKDGAQGEDYILLASVDLD